MSQGRWAFVCIMLVVSLACGSGEQSGSDAKAVEEMSAQELEAAWEQASEMIEQGLEAVASAEAAQYPCSLFEQQEVETLLGNELEPASYAFEHVSEDDWSYQAETCRWMTFADEANEAALTVSQAKHFTSGKVECPPPANADTGPYAPRSLSGIGTSAWWSWEKSWGGGELIACSEKARLKVHVELAGEDETAALSAARSLATRAFESL